MMHDFALTGSYVVLLDLPVTFSLNAVTAGRELPYVWNPAHQARVGLLPRDGSAPVRWIEIEPCWVFHCLNAYDDDRGRVVVDLCQYNQSFDVSTLWAAHGPVTLDRWIIDPAAGKVTQQRLDDRGQEFPRVDDRVISRPHRYGYSAVIGEVTRAITAAGDFADDAFTNAILRHDLARGTVEAHEFGRDATAGEAVFAPSSPDAAEDDGYRHGLRPQPRPRRRRPCHPRRPGLHRRAGRPRAPASPDPARLPRQLDPRPVTPPESGRSCAPTDRDYAREQAVAAGPNHEESHEDRRIGCPGHRGQPRARPGVRPGAGQPGRGQGLRTRAILPRSPSPA